MKPLKNLSSICPFRKLGENDLLQNKGIANETEDIGCRKQTNKKTQTEKVFEKITINRNVDM